MYSRGLPSFDRDSQTLMSGKMKTPVTDVRAVEAFRAFGFLWGVRVMMFDGGERTFVSASRGGVRAAEETALEDCLFGLTQAATSAWNLRFTAELEANGSFVHEGVSVRADGTVTDGRRVGNLGVLRFGHEIEGDILRLRFSGIDTVVVEWKPGLARDAAISVIYDIRERRRSLPKVGLDPSTERLRKKAKARIDEVIRDLATVLARADLPAGRAKLAGYLANGGMAPAGSALLSIAPRLLVNKSYIQKAFGDIQRFHERTSQVDRTARLFEELIELAVVDGKLNARQLFALYELGLHLLYSLPRITAMISAIQTGRDPVEAAAEADRLEREAAERRMREQLDRERRRAAWEEARAAGEDPGPDPSTDPGFDDFEFEEVRVATSVPAALIPMMAVLGLAEITDEKSLRTAWTTKVRQCHPDTLPPGSSPEALEEATQAAAECNMAYSLLLDFVRGRK